MVYAGGEVDFGRLERVVGRKVDCEEEYASSIVGVALRKSTFVSAVRLTAGKDIDEWRHILGP